MAGVTEANKTVHFIILDETGPNDILLFGCKSCPDRKLTSHQLEFHMASIHQGTKFTVDSATVNRNRGRNREATASGRGNQPR